MPRVATYPDAVSGDRKRHPDAPSGSRRAGLADLAVSDATRAAAQRRRLAQAYGGARVDALDTRCRATVCGVLRSVALRPGEFSSTLEAVLCDGTATVDLVWLGRRCVPGIEPGRGLRAYGTLTERHGRRVIFNPVYDLLPADA